MQKRSPSVVVTVASAPWHGQIWHAKTNPQTRRIGGAANRVLEGRDGLGSPILASIWPRYGLVLEVRPTELLKEEMGLVEMYVFRGVQLRFLPSRARFAMKLGVLLR